MKRYLCCANQPYEHQDLTLHGLFSNFFSFLRSMDFQKAVLLAVAAVLPILVSYFFGNVFIGISMAMGVLMSAPSDIAGRFRRKIIGVGLSILLAFSATLIMRYTADYSIINIAVLCLLIFSFSLFSVYGFRASLISFSGLFAVILSYVEFPFEYSIIGHVVFIGCGGLWYLMLSGAFHFLMPQKEVEELLSEIFERTGEYLHVRTELLTTPPSGRRELEQKLSGIHSTLNEKHETLRELVIVRRKNSGKSGGVRKKILLLAETVDILELAMANPLDHKRMDLALSQQPEKMKLLVNWSFLMAEQLHSFSDAFKKNRSYHLDSELEKLYEQSKKATFASIEEKKNLEKEALLILRGVFHFKEKQYQKLISIERLLGNMKSQEGIIKPRDAEKFIPVQDYSPNVLFDHLDFESPIFRHSLRLTFILLIGYLLGNLLELQNTYWILLTSMVIMRPGYGLTKERFKQRLYGTLIGGAIAALITFLIKDLVVFGFLAVVTLILAFSMIQKNYKAAAAFITLNIVFVYSLISPDAFEVIEFRILDTAIGAGLAYLGNVFLWPAWEYKNFNLLVKDGILANRDFLVKINELYEEKNIQIVEYKLARKKAFLAIGKLNAAFQRMTQEPKSKQKDLKRNYRIVSLNQELLSSLASLGSFVRTHPTTSPSKHFKTYISVIQSNLSDAATGFEGKPLEVKTPEVAIEKADIYFQDSLNKLMNEDEAQDKGLGAKTRLQEAQLVRDQLRWMLEISEKLQKKSLGA